MAYGSNLSCRDVDVLQARQIRKSAWDQTLVTSDKNSPGASMYKRELTAHAYRD